MKQKVLSMLVCDENKQKVDCLTKARVNPDVIFSALPFMEPGWTLTISLEEVEAISVQPIK